MPSETAVDALRRKGWVQRDDREEDMVAADDARESAAKTTGRRRSPLYDHGKSDSEEDAGTKALKERTTPKTGFLYRARKDEDALDSMKISKEVPRRKADDEED